MNSAAETDILNGIAVIGMACRFPGASSVQEYWRNLRAGVESITSFSDEELIEAGIPAEQVRRPEYVKAASMIEGIELFDAGFFGFNPREAEIIDVQQRLFLECAWEALETAGYDPDRCDGRVGVFGGSCLNTYSLDNIYKNPDALKTASLMQWVLGFDKDYLATITSYKLNLRGPSLNVQTACSTSLVAVHLACQNLLTYQCDMALAGGVNITVPQKQGYVYSEGSIFSPDGRCRAFDADAGGTVFGNGVGLVVLKRLEDALAGGDSIDAVILASAVNNDGAVKVGFSAPGVRGQAEVIATAQALAGVDPETISYIETHGTGTALGDPIELSALEQVFRRKTGKRGFCAIGSVKPNIGHLHVAAGVAGLIKASLALRHRQIPPSLNFEKPNPQIDFASSPFYVNTRLAEWKPAGPKLRAGLSSFGIGGTNAHAILEEAPEPAPSGPSRPWQLLLLSARSDEALRSATERQARHLRERPEQSLADVAYTLQVGRKRFEHRRFLVCRDREDALEVLEGRQPKRLQGRIQERIERSVAFLFPGQGVQHVGMGRELYAAEPVFRAEVDRCAELLRPHLGLDLRRLLAPASENREEAELQLRQTAIAQPALFVVEYALAKVWMSWGIKPECLSGHSVGEYVAACLAGVFTLESALEIVAVRGRLMQSLPPGAMISVPLPEREIVPLLGDDLALAAVNGPSLCVVAGPEESVERLRRRLVETGIEPRPLHTSHAFHSPMMAPILAAFGEEVARHAPQPPRIPFVSNLDGTWIEAGEATDPGYWVRQLRQTVRFGAGMEELLREPGRVLLEVGPGRTLATFARAQPRWSAERVAVQSLPHPKEGQSGLAFLLTSLGQLWMAGVDVGWKGFYSREQRRRVVLPTYPFQRERYWTEPPSGAEGPKPVQGNGPRLKADPADWFYLPMWSQAMLPLPVAAGELAASRWLVLRDELGLGDVLASRLRSEGQDVVTVEPGSELSQRDGRSWTLHPGRLKEWSQLLRNLLAADWRPDRIVHLWSLTATPGATGFAALQDRGFYSLLYLAQALGEVGLTERLHLGIVTNSLWRILGGDVPEPEKATLLGPARVIPNEYTGIACRTVEVDLPAAGEPLEPWTDRLLAELAAGRTEGEVAYRGDQCWIPEVRPLRLEGSAALDRRLRQHGVYLVTGGLGGVGLTLAETLARTVQARLVLVGRSGLPAEESWPAWIAAHGEEDSVTRKIRQVLALREAGAEVVVAQADVTDAGQMAAVVRETLERFGALHGVLHGAGVPGGGLIQFKTPQDVETVMAPKVRGTLALAAAVADLPLDFFVLHASTIGLTGDVGQVDYCGANAFLDAFAQANTARGQLTLSIDWTFWREVGMAADFGKKPAPTPAPSDNPAVSRGLSEAPRESFDGDREVVHPLLGRRLHASEDEELFAVELGAASHWLLREHKVFGEPVLPGVAYLEMARAAFAERAAGRMIELRDVQFQQILSIPEGGTREVRTSLRRNGHGFIFSVRSQPRPQGPWVEHARGVVDVLEGADEPAGDLVAGEAPAAEAAAGNPLGGPEGRTAGSVFWGQSWCEIRERRLDEGTFFFELPHERAGDLETFYLYPPLLDVATAASAVGLSGGSFLPASYGALRVRGPLERRTWVRFRPLDGGVDRSGTASFDLSLVNEDGRELVQVERFTLKRIGGSAAAESRGATVDGIGPDRAGDLFLRALTRVTRPQVAISVRDLPWELERLRRSAEPAQERADAAVASASSRHRRNLPSAYAAPRDESERAMVELWEKALGFDQVGIHDDFFSLGGHSLLAVQLLARIRETFDVALSMDALFGAPTIAEVCEALRRMQGAEPGDATAAPAVEKVDRAAAGLLPLSFGQQRLWVVEQLNPGTAGHNVTRAPRLYGPLDATVLRRSLLEIARRHEALRTHFESVDGRGVQVVTPLDDWLLPVVDLRGLPEERWEDEARKVARMEVQRPFDLGESPLVRTVLVRLADESAIMHFTAHHIIFDHWSGEVFTGELMVCYAEFSAGRRPALPELPVQYADYALWQRGWMQGETLEKGLAYWRRQLLGAPKGLRLPLDRPRSETPSHRGGVLPLAIPKPLAAALRSLGQGEKATLFMTLLAAFKTLLYHMTGDTDLVVGTHLANRNRREIERLIGFFINSLPLRTQLSGSLTFRQLLQRVREVALETYAHQDVPLDRVVAELQPERTLHPSPLFDVLFVMQSDTVRVEQGEQAHSQIVSQGLVMEPFSFSTGISRFDLALFLNEGEGAVQGNWEYRTELFDPRTIARMSRRFETLLAAAAASPDARLDDLESLTEEEKAERALAQQKQKETSRRRLQRVQPRAVSLLEEEPAAVTAESLA